MAVLECPICHKTVSFVSRDEVPFRPFCSERCKLVDLGRWLSGEYRISEEIGESLRETDLDETDIDGA